MTTVVFDDAEYDRLGGSPDGPVGQDLHVRTVVKARVTVVGKLKALTVVADLAPRSEACAPTSDA